jgi:GH15 family glucan-1,4-alpha-glucosidase
MRAAQSPPLVRCRDTERFWNEWVNRLELPSIATDAVKRSALTLRGLIYGPTGAIAAAGTTSLPEELGGVRNWDYRYCWPRDASIAALALTKLNTQGEAMAFLDWMLGVLEHTKTFDQLHPLYTVTGDELNSEGEIGELAGYAGSRPVRVGNAAAHQIQLDVFGPVAELIYELALRDAPLTPAHWHLIEAMVGAVDVRWREPDHGIWEIRGRRSHHVHSKVMCWFTLDRALKISLLMRDKEPEGWAALRDTIKEEILDRGWKEHVGAFTASYEGDDIDSACLLVGLTGLLPHDDERVRRTLEVVERDLLDGAGLYRYRYDDRLPGFEGTFLLSTCWFILSKVLVGEHDRARELFDAYLTQVGPMGLLGEEFDAERGIALGNYPQAYSHAGLIECAVALAGLTEA